MLQQINPKAIVGDRELNTAIGMGKNFLFLLAYSWNENYKTPILCPQILIQPKIKINSKFTRKLNVHKQQFETTSTHI